MKGADVGWLRGGLPLRLETFAMPVSGWTPGTLIKTGRDPPISTQGFSSVTCHLVGQENRRKVSIHSSLIH